MAECALTGHANKDLPIDHGSSSVLPRDRLKHGLTASLELRQRVDELRGKFRDELRPAGITESLLVDEMARHAAALGIAELAEGAVLRHGTRQLGNLISPSAEDFSDATLTAAISSESIERLTRYRRAHERGFFAALSKLQEIRAQRPSATSAALTEEACRTLLRRRFEQPGWRCPRCTNSQGSWLAARDRWQCSRCRSQVGLRGGTVMEGSPLALVTWFAATRLVLQNKSISVADLAMHLDIRRHKTVRRLLRTIHQALDSARGSNVAETSAPIECFLQSRTSDMQLLQVLTKPRPASEFRG